MIPGFSDALIKDRKELLFNDSLRTFVLVMVVAATLWFFVKKKIKLSPILVVLGIILLYDGIDVAKDYVNKDDFMSARRIEKPFKASDIDKAILQNKGHYRVANFTVNPMNDGSTSYFHKSIGGYHAAKPRRYQELFDYQIAKNNDEILNMLNVKYLIISDKDGKKQLQENTEAYGNAWFANEITWVNSANEEIQALDSVSKAKVIINKKYKDLITNNQIKTDSSATISLHNYAPDLISFDSNSKHSQLAVFSEMYYPYGWIALIDDVEQEIIPVNYVLRALEIPEGKHSIVFKFRPDVVKKGGMYSLIGYILFVGLIIVGWFFRKKL